MRPVRVLVNWLIVSFPLALILLMLLMGQGKELGRDDVLAGKKWIWDT